MKSRAVVRSGPRKIELRELDVPADPPPGGAIMRVLANGICGSDYDHYSGRFKSITVPVVPGHEPIGRIEAIDPIAAELWGVSEGDRVAVEIGVRCRQCRNCRLGRERHCTNGLMYTHISVDVAPGLWGGMADYMMLLPGSFVYRVPEELNDEDAALFNPFGNAFEWTARVGQVQVGDRVLILGGGQRGIASAAVASAMGARQVIVTGRNPAKLALAREFGATDTINVLSEDTVATVNEMTDGEGVDVVIDSIPGATEPIVHAIEALRPEGRLVLAGIKGREVSISPDRVMRKGLNLVGAVATTPWATLNALELITSNRFPFAKLHSHRFGLESAEHALQLLGGEIPGEMALHITMVP